MAGWHSALRISALPHGCMNAGICAAWHWTSVPLLSYSHAASASCCVDGAFFHAEQQLLKVLAEAKAPRKSSLEPLPCIRHTCVDSSPCSDVSWCSQACFGEAFAACFFLFVLFGTLVDSRCGPTLAHFMFLFPHTGLVMPLQTEQIFFASDQCRDICNCFSSGYHNQYQ